MIAEPLPDPAQAREADDKQGAVNEAVPDDTLPMP